MEEHASPTLTLGPVTFDLTMVLVSVVTISIIFLLVFWTSRRMELKPKGKQNVLEYVYELTINFTKGNLGDEDAKRYSLFFFTVFTFLLLANNLGLMTKIETAEGHNLWTSPTANMAYDFGLATIAIVFCHIEGIRRQGFKGYLKGFVTPPAMTPMNILEEVTNLISLALRLYGNIYAGEVLVSLLLQLSQQSVLAYPIALLLNIVWTAFSVFISCSRARQLVKTGNLFEILYLIRLVIDGGKHIDSDKIEYIKTKSLTIESLEEDNRIMLNLDGEYGGDAPVDLINLANHIEFFADTDKVADEAITLDTDELKLEQMAKRFIEETAHLEEAIK